MKIGSLQVATALAELVDQEILPPLAMERDKFWSEVEAIINDFTARNTALLHQRIELQNTIDEYHRRHQNDSIDYTRYRTFLQDIGYLLPEGPDFKIETTNVDKEISTQAGPQLVVPVDNARFALNACNARWGSLYDALYGTDVIPEDNGAERRGDYNPVRGALVIAYGRQFLDQIIPLAAGSHADANAYGVIKGELVVVTGAGTTGLCDASQLAGLRGDAGAPDLILLRHHDLHVEIHFDRNTEVGRSDSAGISDIIVEAAVTTIQDCEDSVAAVDSEDKVAVYRNWLGLVLGTLEHTFIKDGTTLTRALEPDRQYTGRDGTSFSLPGRSLLLVRNVGHLMRNAAILDGAGEEVYEGILDAIITSAIAALDLNGASCVQNSRTGSIYIVKPKMHGPEEVTFTCDLFARVESLLGLPVNTIKLGIMDEERRTTLNLKECIRAARQRLVFINTGFLDRTGDEIHTSMEAGAMVAKGDMKTSAWIDAYEKQNVCLGLRCGLAGRAQIGKGMWAMPDRMADMLEQKIAHPEAGASTAWVPSPTAAVLHALHYHQVNVSERQRELMKLRGNVKLQQLLTIPLLPDSHTLTAEQIQRELDNNIQGILGYVVRWVDQGIGCSKVPDINNVGLMEDRATLRISSQHIANWLRHGLCKPAQVRDTFARMAAVVDQQNQHDPAYQAMAPGLGDSLAFQSALALVFEGCDQPNGYTEPILHKFRQLRKQA